MACIGRVLPRGCAQCFSLNSADALSLRQSRAAAVAHTAIGANPVPRSGVYCWFACLASSAFAIGHKPEAVAQVVRTRARGFDRHCPHGVFQGFQITSHKSEPVSSGRNLLSKDCCRIKDLDEVAPVGPEVTVVSKPKSFARLGERLARTAASPNRSMIGITRASQCERPAAEAGEEVDLGEGSKVVRNDVNDASPVDDAVGNEALSYQVLEPVAAIRIDLVVEIHPSSSPVAQNWRQSGVGCGRFKS